MRIVSQAFQQEARIPKKYTCEDRDVSPPLAIEGVPAAARSLALVVEDPDAPDPAAPSRIWVHWVLYDLPPTTQALAEGIGSAPSIARDGKNDWGSVGYRGPCPPIGRHRYFVRLHALDAMLGDLGSPTKTELESAMRGHVLESAELMGTYQKGD